MLIFEGERLERSFVGELGLRDRECVFSDLGACGGGEGAGDRLVIEGGLHGTFLAIHEHEVMGSVGVELFEPECVSCS